MTEPARGATHDTFRDLISARLDEPLAVGLERDLSLHLLGCPRCRQFDHDLVDQRRLMRALPPPVVPRDLWARTSAALDRELLREAQHDRRAEPSPRASGRLAELATPGTLPSMLMVSAASFTLAVVLLITQLGPAIRLPDEVTGLPTPFGEPGVALAFVGADAGGLTLYRTRVDQDCPASTGCTQGDEVAARVTFAADFHPNNLALAPSGDRLAIMGSDVEREDVFAVLVVPPLPEANLPEDDLNPGRTRRPVATTPAAEPPLVVVATPSSSQPAFVDPTAVIPAELSVSTILDGVYGVGAAPAWSADGQALAFSAMPSDRRHGPDIYIWRVGDQRARAITFDHSSYFASWSNSAIVVSRAGRAGEAWAAPVVTTVAIDAATGDERLVDGPQVWLPQVDPTNSRAVAWHGRLAWDGVQVVPTHGALYLLDWATLDPFAADRPQATPDLGDVDLNGSRSETSSAPGSLPAPPVLTPASVAPDGSPAAAGSTAPDLSPAPDVSPAADESPAPTRTPGRPRAPIGTEAPSPRPLDSRLTPIEPDRDWLQQPVTDWRVMWSADGRMLGRWIVTAPASDWGQLSVFAIDLHGRIDSAQPLLEPTLARRGFNLARNRIAWVAPQAGTVSGELRLRLWDSSGVRDVRVRPVESAGVVAAF